MTILNFHNNPVNWDSFWIAVSSGLIYSVIVGLSVSITIYIIQRRAEDRRLKRDCYSDLLDLAAHIYTLTALGPLNRRLESDPLDCVKTMPTIREYGRIALWRRVLPEHDAFFDIIDDYEDSFEMFAYPYQLIDKRLIAIVNNYLSTHGHRDDTDFKEIARKYCWGILFEETESKLFVDLNLTRQQRALLQRLLASMQKDLLHDKTVVTDIEKCRTGRSMLVWTETILNAEAITIIRGEKMMRRELPLEVRMQQPRFFFPLERPRQRQREWRQYRQRLDKRLAQALPGYPKRRWWQRTLCQRLGGIFRSHR